MFGTHFYHEKTRKCVAAFGRLFNNIYVVRKTSGGTGLSQLKVPLSYAPKAKYLDRIRENPDLDTDTKVALKLPRMSFEITSINYDTTRQLSKLNSVQGANSNTARNKLFTGVPYILGFQLNIYAKSQDDALQIMEQILPTFNPQYTLTMLPLKADYPTFKEDIPISIAGVGFTDDFDGELAARRTIVYTIDFEMRIQYHSGISSFSIIRQSNARIFDQAGGVSGDSDTRLETIQINPDPLTTIGLADSDFGFTTTIFDADSDYR